MVESAIVRKLVKPVELRRRAGAREFQATGLRRGVANPRRSPSRARSFSQRMGGAGGAPSGAVRPGATAARVRALLRRAIVTSRTRPGPDNASLWSSTGVIHICAGASTTTTPTAGTTSPTPVGCASALPPRRCSVATTVHSDRLLGRSKAAPRSRGATCVTHAMHMQHHGAAGAARPGAGGGRGGPRAAVVDGFGVGAEGELLGGVVVAIGVDADGAQAAGAVLVERDGEGAGRRARPRARSRAATRRRAPARSGRCHAARGGTASGRPRRARCCSTTRAAASRGSEPGSGSRWIGSSELIAGPPVRA